MARARWAAPPPDPARLARQGPAAPDRSRTPPAVILAPAATPRRLPPRRSNTPSQRWRGESGPRRAGGRYNRTWFERIPVTTARQENRQENRRENRNRAECPALEPSPFR